MSEINCYISDMVSLATRILDRAKSGAPGAVFTPKTFDDIGGRPAVAQALRRLTKGGNIRRVYRGVYDVPINHATLGRISADAENVAKAIADRSGFRLQPTPARAANLLSLSAQAPAQIVYFLEGRSRRIKVANEIIHLRHAGPRALLGAGTPAGVAIQAISGIRARAHYRGRRSATQAQAAVGN